MKQSGIFHNSHQLKYRTPFGAVCCREKVGLCLEFNKFSKPDEVILRLWQDDAGEEKIKMDLSEHKEEKLIYQGWFIAPSSPGLVWYYFIVHIGNKTYYYGNNSAHLGGVGQLYWQEPPSYQITVYKDSAATPAWFKDAVIYQIFVDRFYNGYEDRTVLGRKDSCHVYTDWHNDVPVYRRDHQTGKIICYDFFGGNLLGIIKKLPYLKQLGINLIYLNPIFESVSNHKYDVGDYKNIDPMFGDDSLFELLYRQAKEMGIAIILDGVFSHTGADSIYFNKEGNYPGIGAYQSKESFYYSWYRFYHHPDKYDCWWGIDSMPNVNELEPSYQDFIIYGKDSVLKHWLKMGIKGWRLDVVDELPDQFIKSFWKIMKQEDKESVLIGEVWEDASNKKSYGKRREYLGGEELDSVTNYPFRKIFLNFLLGEKTARETHLELMQIYENYPLPYFYSTMNLIGSHDVVRVLTLLGDAPAEEKLSKKEQSKYRLSAIQKKLAIQRLKLFSLIQMTFPGAPCIYYGDEAGMEGYSDPLNRGTYPWGRENKELIRWYQEITSLRNRCAVLRTGEWISFYFGADVYGYLRRIKNNRDLFGEKRENGTAILLFNRNRKEEVNVQVNLSRYCRGMFLDVFANNQEIDITGGSLELTLSPLEGKLLWERDLAKVGG